jgi:hypothetical protein
LGYILDISDYHTLIKNYRNQACVADDEDFGDYWRILAPKGLDI